MMTNSHPHGTNNVLKDLGFADAEVLSAKADLAHKVNELLDQLGLTQIQAAKLTGMTQPKVSQVRRYKLCNISLERLMMALVSLGQDVDIVVRRSRRGNPPDIRVATGRSRTKATTNTVRSQP